MKSMTIMLGSDNAKALGEFYIKVLGKPDWQQEDWTGFAVGDAFLMIGSHSDIKGKNQEPARSMINFSVDDVPGEFERIKALGAEVIAEPYHPGMDEEGKTWLATLADPDGNYFQLATPWEG